MLVTQAQKPAATIVLSKGVQYETWKKFLCLALQSAGLLYPTIPPPPALNDVLLREHKGKFFEYVAARLRMDDLNRISHATEPLDVLQAIEELKKPPFVGRCESVAQEWIEMKSVVHILTNMCR